MLGERCDQPLIEIDHYGDRLTGCLKCNVWRGIQLVIQLPEEDLEALRKLRDTEVRRVATED
jgi:hypothetical protein